MTKHAIDLSSRGASRSPSRKEAMMKKSYAIFIFVFVLSVSAGCKKSSQSILPEFPKKPPKVIIGTPGQSSPYNLVGSDTILDVGFGVEKFSEDPWPPPNFDRVECYIDGRRVASYRPADVIHPQEMNYEEMIYLGQIVDFSRFESGKWYWYLSCGRGLTAKDFGPPGHNKTLTVRVWYGDVYGEDTVFFDYDDDALDQAACEYIHHNMLGYPRATNRYIRPYSTTRIYYTTQGTVIDDLIDVTLRWMGKRLGITFIKTNNMDAWPLFLFLKNECCGAAFEGDWGDNVFAIGADLGIPPPDFWAISGYANIICHETGHGLGLPHDNEEQYFDSCMQVDALPDHPNNQLILHAYQQRAFHMGYQQPVDYDWSTGPCPP